MNLDSILNLALTTLKGYSNADLTFTKSDGTVVTANVFRGHSNYISRDIADSGYEENLDDLFIIAKTSFVDTWGLAPMTSKVQLDGVNYMVGKSINKTAQYWTIYLRKYRA
jgi:hypothetical protein